MGGFGKVYQGFLSDGNVVAIKCASLQSAQGQKEFQNELMLLGRLHHRNLVGLEGFCDDGGLQVGIHSMCSYVHLARSTVVCSHDSKSYDSILSHENCTGIGLRIFGKR